MLVPTWTALSPGTHACLLHDGPEELFAAVIPFVQQGLAARERCLVLGAPETLAPLAEALRAGGVDVEQEAARGTLRLSSERDHLVDGRFAHDAVVRQLEQAIDEALAEGFSGLRVTGDLLWQLGPERDPTRVEAYERVLEGLFRGRPLIGLCQYHRAHLPPEVLATARRTHPVVVGPDVPPPEEERRRHIAGLGLLADTATQLLRHGPSEALLHGMLERTCGLLDLDAGFAWRMAEDGEHLQLLASHGLDADTHEGLERRSSGQHLCGAAARTEHPVLLADVSTSDDATHALLQELGLASYACLPLKAEDRLLGKLSFGRRVPGGFSPESLALLRALVDQVALAMHRAELLHEQRLALEAMARAKEAAEQASRAKDEFLATVSHELRTPLSAILLWAKMLGAGLVRERDRTEAVHTIEKSAEAQRQLIEDLLDVSRMVSGQLRVDMREVVLGEVVDAALEAVRPMALARGVSLVPPPTLPGAEPPRVRGDPDRLRQVAWNLLVNAVKFTPRGGRVTLSLVRGVDGGGLGVARLGVLDTGQGIAPDFLPHVFERFRQAESGTTRQHGGLGLGLALVRELVQIHGGTVSAHSAGEGRGAAFTVELPLLETPRAPARVDARVPAAPLLTGVEVLLVEDHPETRRAMAFVLAASGAHVREVASVPAALEALGGDWTPDVLVSDIGLPGEDGHVLLRRARALASEWGARRVPALAISAYARAEDRDRALASGFAAWLPKPVEPVALVRVIAGLCGRSVPK